MATIGDVTWLHRQYPTVSWNTAGGDHDPAPTGTSNTPQSGPTHWASSPPMVACVQDWLDDPATNFGWLLRTDEAISRAVRRFDSRQHPSPTMRPALEITYLPLGSWAVVGPGCGAPAPTLTLSGSFGPGGAMVLQLQSTPNLLAISFLGLTLARPARALTPGCLIHIAPTSLLTTDLMQLDVAGQLALPIAIPATPVFTGLPIAAQSGVLDPGLPSGFGLSNATLALLL